MFHGSNDDKKNPQKISIREFFSVYRYGGQAISLVWKTNRTLTIILVILVVVSGIIPAAIAYFGKLIIDMVVLASQTGLAEHRNLAIFYILVEMALVIFSTAGQRGIAVCRALLRAQLGYKVNTLILEKALTLELNHFEDSKFYDKMTRARREASSRPLSLVMRTFSLVQHSISMVAYGVLLLQFSGWATLLLVAAVIPSFIAETRFSGEAFRLFRWRTPETRQQMYLETIIAREDYAKEVSIFGIGPKLLERYKDIFVRLYQEDRHLTLRRNFWGYCLGIFSSLAFYSAYIWIAIATIAKSITLGDMAMYILVFKQGQGALGSTLNSINGMYEDNLYLSNLYEFLDTKTTAVTGAAHHGPDPEDGIRFENVSFTYPGAQNPAVENISFHLQPGKKLALVGENGSGKTTLIKLLTCLYPPTSGRILIHGLDLREWDRQSLRQKIAVIFQDFVRYQFTVGENIGVGDIEKWEEESLWNQAAEKGMASSFIEALPQQYKTQLGRWFYQGQELSLGQWQKIALSRAFMRNRADIFVLDEPTASMDAEAEYQIFTYFQKMTQEQIVIFISHRFSTVRMADYIIVLHKGKIIENGNHQQLIEDNGHYAHLFSLQAQGYQ